MKIKTLASAVALFGSLALATSANAAIWVTTGPYGGSTAIDFETPNPYAGIGTFSGNFGIYTGNSAAAAPPSPQTGAYGAVTGIATLELDVATTYFGLFWGSVDGYNTISFYDSNDFLLGSYTGSDALNPANGNQGTGGSKYANFSFATGIQSIKFESNSPAFEFDNIATAVPEASTWAMMILGFLGMGFVGYRKSSKSSKSPKAAFRFA